MWNPTAATPLSAPGWECCKSCFRKCFWSDFLCPMASSHQSNHSHEVQYPACYLMPICLQIVKATAGLLSTAGLYLMVEHKYLDDWWATWHRPVPSTQTSVREVARKYMKSRLWLQTSTASFYNHNPAHVICVHTQAAARQRSITTPTGTATTSSLMTSSLLWLDSSQWKFGKSNSLIGIPIFRSVYIFPLHSLFSVCIDLDP